jgi:RHS repeat-associated protein
MQELAERDAWPQTERVLRSGYTDDNCDSTGKRGYVYDLEGHIIVETNNSDTDCDIQVWLGDRHFGRQGGGTYFYHTDWLGTVRLINFDTNPTSGAQTCTSLPFGDGLNCNSSWVNDFHFTGKQHDFETGLDNFGARFDASSLGRFLTPDPLLNSGHPAGPQSWDRYAYGGNNPLNLIDPTGLFDFRPTICAAPQDGGCTQEQIDEHNTQEQQFRDALGAINSAILGLRGGSPAEIGEQQRLQSILDFYGTEGDGNGVMIGFGSLNDTNEPNAIARTDENPNGGILVTFDTNKFKADDLFAFGGIAAHEGTHGMDTRRPTAGPGLTKFQKEYRADMSRSFFLEGYFLFTTSATGGALYNWYHSSLWNSSWWGPDQQTLRDHAVTAFTEGRGRPGTYVAPAVHDPW